MALAAPGSKITGYGTLGFRTPMGASGALAGFQQQTGGSGVMASPMGGGVSPMARLASGTGTVGSPTTRLGAGASVGTGGTALGSSASTNPMANEFEFTPETYSKDVEASYAEQISQNAKDAAAAQNMAQNYAAGLQRRNASNAAIGGYSVGGGGFLAGQNMAGMEGIANAQDIARRYSDQAVGIRQNQANYRAGVDQRNAARAGEIAYNDYVYNRGRTDTLADKKADADATAFGNQVTSAAGDYAAKLANYGINFEGGVGHGVGWAEAMPLLTAVKTAKTPAELAKAKADLDAWLAKREGARQEARNSNTYLPGDKEGEANYLKSIGW